MTHADLFQRPRCDERADPFGEHVPRRTTMVRHVLGSEIRFDSDNESLLALVQEAYGGLPEHRIFPEAPELQVELRLMKREGSIETAGPPPVRTQAGADLLCGVMDACNYAVVAPAQRRALIVASADMLERHAYHLRYELIEFAVFILASRTQSLVPLHGACVGRDGRGLLLLGKSGVGKSTLALHAWLQGMDFLAEDAVFVQPDNLLATGVSNFLHLKDDAFRFVTDEQVRSWIRSSPTIRRRSGVEKYEVDMRVGQGALAPTPLKLVGIAMVSERPAPDPKQLLSRLPDERIPQWLSVDQPYAAARPEWDRFRRASLRLGVHRLDRGSHPNDGVAALSALLG